MSDLSREARQLLDTAPAPAPGPEERTRMKQAVLAAVAAPAAAAAAATAASAGAKPVGTLLSGVLGKVLAGTAVIALGAGAAWSVARVRTGQEVVPQPHLVRSAPAGAALPPSSGAPEALTPAAVTKVPPSGAASRGLVAAAAKRLPSGEGSRDVHRGRSASDGPPGSAGTRPSAAGPAERVVEGAATSPGGGDLAAGDLPGVPEPADEPPAQAEPATGPPAAPASASAVREELDLLYRAKSQRDASQWAAALDALDRYDARFPAGVLRTEAQALRVLTLCALERTSEARALAQQLLHSDPSMPAVRRLASSCAGP